MGGAGASRILSGRHALSAASPQIRLRRIPRARNVQLAKGDGAWEHACGRRGRAAPDVLSCTVWFAVPVGDDFRALLKTHRSSPGGIVFVYRPARRGAVGRRAQGKRWNWSAGVR